MVGAFGGRAGVRWLIAVSATAPLAAPAFAGAWGQPEGTMLGISTLAHSKIDRGETWRAETLTEAGFGDGWSANFKLDGEWRLAGPESMNNSWRLGGQKSFAIGDRGSVAIAATYIGGDANFGSYCQGDGGEVRGAAGTSFNVLGREAFVNVEAGWRSRGEEDCNGMVGEIAFGMEVTKDWTATVKSWGEDAGDGRSTKVEASLGRSFGSFDISLGWREEVSGDFQEKGWLVSLFTRY